MALADKLDTLAGFFAIDERPTGSKDPFALRRAALGVIRLIIENKLRLWTFKPDTLARSTCTATVLRCRTRRGYVGYTQLVARSFFGDRLKVRHLREMGSASRSRQPPSLQRETRTT